MDIINLKQSDGDLCTNKLCRILTVIYYKAFPMEILNFNTCGLSIKQISLK